MKLWGVSGILGRVRKARQDREDLLREIEEIDRRVCALPVEIARNQALRILARGNPFACDPILATDVLPSVLPHTLREVFGLYRHVNWSGPAYIGLDYWEPCPGLDRNYIIGEDTERS